MITSRRPRAPGSAVERAAQEHRALSTRRAEHRTCSRKTSRATSTMRSQFAHIGARGAPSASGRGRLQQRVRPPYRGERTRITLHVVLRRPDQPEQVSLSPGAHPHPAAAAANLPSNAGRGRRRGRDSVHHQGVLILDATIMNVTLPHIDADALDFGPQLSSVLNAYTLALRRLLLLGAHLGDIFGRHPHPSNGIAVSRWRRWRGLTRPGDAGPPAAPRASARPRRTGIPRPAGQCPRRGDHDGALALFGAMSSGGMSLEPAAGVGASATSAPGAEHNP